MTAQDRKFMEAAIEASRKSRVDLTGGVPRVGAVAVIRGEIVGVAYREERAPGQHAEYVLLQEYLPYNSLVNATIYTTLEPCTRRGEGKIPCVDRLIERRVGRVVIGMLDPNPIVRGLGFRKLRQANIKTDVFPHDLMSQVEALNRDFVRAIENNPIHQTTQEIAVLASKSKHDRQREAVSRSLELCANLLRRIHRGQVPIPGKEAGYFSHWLELVESFQGVESVKAYIRIPAFDPTELMSKNWFREFYKRLGELVKSGKLSIRYVFLLGTLDLSPQVREFLDSFKGFAEEVRIVDAKGARLSAEELKPSIVLFENQRAVFTHDRGDNTVLLEADEWIFKSDYERLNRQFSIIELASSVYFRRLGDS